MKVKTSELSGKALDWAVWSTQKDPSTIKPRKGYQLNIPKFSSDWAKCGPLIEQFKLSLYLHAEYEIKGVGVYDVYEAGCSADWFVDSEAYDPVSTDPKVAICRAVVSAKLGDEVEIPDELMEVRE